MISIKNEKNKEYVGRTYFDNKNNSEKGNSLGKVGVGRESHLNIHTLAQGRKGYLHSNF